MDQEEIKYHLRPCYSNYKKQADRSKKKRGLENDENVPQDVPSTSGQTETRSSKRLKMDPTGATPKVKDKESKPCIICNNLKTKDSERTRYRICEADRARSFLSAIKYYKDEVYTRCSLLENIKDVFAEDIMYHKNCMGNYLQKFEREIEKLLNPPLTDFEKQSMSGLFKEFVAKIDIKNKACALSTCRDQFQKYLETMNHAQGISLFHYTLNSLRQLIFALLIWYFTLTPIFGDILSFSYRKN